MRIMLVQYAGDYLQAYRRLLETSTETYYGHRYVLEQLARLQEHFGEVAVLCCKSSRAYNSVLPSGVRVICAGVNRDVQGRKVQHLISKFDPTHLIVLGPLPKLIRLGVRHGCKVMCLFADSFEVSAFRLYLRYGRLRSLLNDRRIDLIANHGINACLSLVNIGVKAEKIIPWDWVYTRVPADLPAKTFDPTSVAMIVFVGSVIERKGVGDAIAGIAALKRRGIETKLMIAGVGEVDRYKALARSLRIQDSVIFLGLISNSDAFDLMRKAALVVVPSQHAYPEGLPLAIYEAHCARTPIVASDHPMFRGSLVHRNTAMIYRAGDPEALADCVGTILYDPELYKHISAGSEQAWNDLQISVKWGDILFRWILNRDEDKCWLHDHRLSGGVYNEHLARVRTTAI